MKVTQTVEIHEQAATSTLQHGARVFNDWLQGKGHAEFSS